MINLSSIQQIFLNITSQYLPTPEKGQSVLGYLILGIILSPVVLLLLASILGKPRKTRITLLFLGFIVFMLGAFISVTYVLGLITGYFF